jgi:hypothetical protein
MPGNVIKLRGCYKRDLLQGVLFQYHCNTGKEIKRFA